MQSKLFIISVVVGVFCASQVFAHEGEGHDESKGSKTEEKVSMVGDKEEYHSELPNVGNAICPISGELISDVGEGKGVQIEHEGKIYNVCCKFCAKDFKKDPEKFTKIIKNNLAEEKDPGRDYESDHNENVSEENKGGQHDGHGEH